MSRPEIPNPERKSDAALLCFCIGAGLAIVAWFLGVGGVMAAALSGGDPVLVAGGIGALIALPLAALAGFVLMLIGGIWIFLRVLADRGAPDRYSRDVER